MSFVHLHVKSEYSLLHSTIRTDSLLKKAQSLSMPAVALTDSNNLFGAIEFTTNSKKLNLDTPINAVVGMEVSILAEELNSTNQSDHSTKPQPRTFKVVLLAKNLEGYQQLVRLTSKAYTNDSHTPYVNFEYFTKNQSECFVLSGGYESELFHLVSEEREKEALSLADKFRSVCGERYYLEIHDHEYEQEKKSINRIVDLAKKNQLPLVATNQVRYLERNDWVSYDVLHAIGTKDQINLKNGQLERKASTYLPGRAYHLKTYEEMLSSFSSLSDLKVLSNSLAIAEACNVTIKDETIHMPVFPLPEQYKGKDTKTASDEYLRDESYRRLATKIKEITPAYKERLDYELKVVTNLNFSAYFIIVADFIDFAKRENILVGGGRGSAAGSLIAFSMGITGLDPLAYGLFFERFLNPDRVSFPDIDIDFEDRRRSEVIEYVKKFYGKNHVANIITFGKLKTKAVFKDVARVFGVNFEDSNQLSSLIKVPSEGEKESNKGKSLLQFNYENNLEFSSRISNEPALSMTYEESLKLENLTRQIGIHAAGIVVSDQPIVNYVPLAQTSDGTFVTQYNMNLLEPYCGLIKIDFLGLKNLSVIQDAVTNIKVLYHKEVNIDKLPFDDAKSYYLFSNELTAGVFQFASTGMKKYLKELQPSTFQELIAMNALYRPGPMDWVPVYIAEQRNRKANFKSSENEVAFTRFKKLCQKYQPLANVLEETKMIPIYQEQVMEICRVYAGFTLGRSDILRKAMGKKDRNLINQLKSEFVSGAERKGNPADDAEFIYDNFIVPFGNYGFNKSHAACYALLAYQTAYLKGNYPLAFMPALLNAELIGGNFGVIQEFVQECLSLHLEVIPPDINYCEALFSVKHKCILFGLAGIKNVGLSTAKSIIAERNLNGKFLDFGDFMLRTGQEKVNKQALEALIKVGAFDSLGGGADNLIDLYPTFSDRLRKEKDLLNQGQHSLFETMNQPKETNTIKNTHLYKDLLDKLINQPSSETKKRNLEFKTLGFNLSYHYHLQYADFIKAHTKFNSLEKKGYITSVINGSDLGFTRQNNSEIVNLEVQVKFKKLKLTIFTKAWKKLKDKLILILKQEGTPEDELIRLTHSSLELLSKITGRLATFRLNIREDSYRSSNEKTYSVDDLKLVKPQEINEFHQPKQVIIKLTNEKKVTTKDLEKLNTILLNYSNKESDKDPSKESVFFQLENDSSSEIYPLPYKVNLQSHLKITLLETGIVKNIEIKDQPKKLT